jgi:hypothetical protein
MVPPPVIGPRAPEVCVDYNEKFLNSLQCTFPFKRLADLKDDNFNDLFWFTVSVSINFCCLKVMIARFMIHYTKLHMLQLGSQSFK